MAPYRIKRLTPAEVLAAAEVRAAAEADDGSVRLGSTSVAASAAVVTATSVGASAATGARVAWSLADDARACASAESHDRGQDLKRQRAGPPLPMMASLDSFNSRALSVELGKRRTPCTAERGAELGTQPWQLRAPPPPLPRHPNAGYMPGISASYDHVTSADTQRPKPAALNSRQLTAELGKARELPELLLLHKKHGHRFDLFNICLLYTSPSPRDGLLSRMPSSA